MPVAIDPREARPLTSREISKVLAGIIGGVVSVSPSQRHFVYEVIRSAIVKESARSANVIPALSWSGEHTALLDICPSWACAFSATVSGLRGWCDPADVQTALNWLAENIETICAAPPANVGPAN